MSTALAVAKTPEQIEDERQELNQQLAQANMLRVNNVIALAADRLQSDLEAKDNSGRYVIPTQAAVASAMVLANTLLTHLRSAPLAFKKRIGAAKKPTVVQFRRVPLEPRAAIPESGRQIEGRPDISGAAPDRAATTVPTAPEVVEAIEPTEILPADPGAAMRSSARAAVVREVTAPTIGTNGWDRGSPEFKAALLAALERAEESK